VAAGTLYLPPGTVIRGNKDSYSIMKILGRGGMSTVYLARGLSSNTYVALKMPKSDSTSIEKLRHEQRILSVIKHVHTVTLIDQGIYRGLPFIAIEYAAGTTLNRVCMGNPLSVEDSLARITELLLALDYIHSKNIIHRDVKPKNIIINDIYYLKLIDFGTSIYFKDAGIREAVISPGGYTPPEQYRYTCSPQGDIWSAGAVLFFLLTGQHPIVDMPGYPSRKYRAPPNPTKFNRDVGEDLAQIIAKAMAWEPINRFSTAAEMIKAIESRKIEEVAERYPVLEIMGERIILDAPMLFFGRLSTSATDTSSKLYGYEERKLVVEKRGDWIYVYIKDPYKWVSRRHFMIFEMNGKWYIKDLGSLNRTAIHTERGLTEIWAGYRKEGRPYILGRKALIYIAYGSSLSQPPYIVATFRA